MNIRIHNLRYYLPFILVLVFIILLIQSSPANGQIQPAFSSPDLIFPPNEQTTTGDNNPPLGIPSFTWRPVVGATLYHLQISTDPLFIMPNILDIHTPNSQYTPTILEPFTDGSYYWRVRVEEPFPGSVFSDPFQFQKAWASGSSTPNLIAPPESAILAFLDDPNFSWESVPGAATYRFQVASSSDNFLAPIYEIDTDSIHHQPEDKFSNGEYFWRVIPVDPSGSFGLPSTARSFILAYGSLTLVQTPILLTPDPNEILQYPQSFQWSAVAGAELYRLEYTQGSICDFTSATVIETSQTSYTPVGNLSSPTMYCWRVRAQSGLSIGDWSEVRSFMHSWDQAPQPLTPTFGYPYTRTPIFNWTPVPGAAYYQVSLTDSTRQSLNDIQGFTSNPYWISPNELPYTEYFWQVTPYDSSDQAGIPSQEFVFQNPLIAPVPSLVYPLYSYETETVTYAGTDPTENRTAAYPVFIWQRVFNPAPFGGLATRAYRIQVSPTPYFSTIEWQLDTQNTIATPTVNVPFNPTPNQDYYWRVCPLDLVLPSQCQVDPNNQQPLWSQVWIARFNQSLADVPTSDDTPHLLRPSHGYEGVENTPLLEWLPLVGASHYEIQISRDPDFSILEHQDNSAIPMYASPISLAQRNLNKTNYGTFYWRVRGYIDGDSSDWSEVWRFQIASQSEWRRVRYLGESNNRLLIGRDPTGDASSNYDLSTLYAAQADTAWFIGFNANTDPANDNTYIIFLDLDHVDNSGGLTLPERPYDVSVISGHQPEYVLYVDQIFGEFSAQNTWIYSWTGTNWSFGQTLFARGGALAYTPGTPGYLEIELPDSAINIRQAPDSLALMILSVNSSGIMLDSVPEDPNIPGTALISRFTSASDRMNIIYPPNHADGDTLTFATVPLLFWDWPTGADPTGNDYAPPTPYAGAQLQVATDPQFSILVADITTTSNAYYIGTPAASLGNDLVGDNRYYWRVRPRYLNAGTYFGAWSATASFTRQGFKPENLTASTDLTTPEFHWEMVEGVSWYQLQLSNQADFDPTIVDVTTPNISYTPPNALAAGNYYWRVGVLREGLTQAVWSETQTLTIHPPAPAGLTPNDPISPITSIPTLCWQPVLIYNDSVPIASAWKYRVQVSLNESFNSILNTAETEMHCWTPQDWYSQDTYYWRVATLDHSGHVGSYSTPAVIILRYTTPTLVNPVSSWISRPPTFTWLPVPGMVSYRLEVSLEPDFSPLLDWIQTVNTIFTPIISYPSSGILYWRVAASNDDGDQSEYASAYTTIGIPDIWLPIVRR